MCLVPLPRLNSECSILQKLEFHRGRAIFQMLSLYSIGTISFLYRAEIFCPCQTNIDFKYFSRFFRLCSGILLALVLLWRTIEWWKGASILENGAEERVIYAILKASDQGNCLSLRHKEEWLSLWIFSFCSWWKSTFWPKGSYTINCSFVLL